MNGKMTRLLITGYKPHELGIFDQKHPGIAIIKKAIAHQLHLLLEQGLEWVIVSGQLGVEMWAAEVVLELKTSHPELKLAVITPFLEQEKNWNDEKKEQYDTIRGNADYVVSLTKRPYEAPWQFVEKDRFLLRNSDALLLVYDEENEGSPKYIKRAAEKHAAHNRYTLVTINADDLQLVVEEEQHSHWDY